MAVMVASTSLPLFVAVATVALALCLSHTSGTSSQQEGEEGGRAAAVARAACPTASVVPFFWRAKERERERPFRIFLAPFASLPSHRSLRRHLRLLLCRRRCRCPNGATRAALSGCEEEKCLLGRRLADRDMAGTERGAGARGRERGRGRLCESETDTRAQLWLAPPLLVASPPPCFTWSLSASVRQ